MLLTIAIVYGTYGDGDGMLYAGMDGNEGSIAVIGGGRVE